MDQDLTLAKITQQVTIITLHLTRRIRKRMYSVEQPIQFLNHRAQKVVLRQQQVKMVADLVY
jgi:hypothetical protein